MHIIFKTCFQGIDIFSNKKLKNIGFSHKLNFFCFKKINNKYFFEEVGVETFARNMKIITIIKKENVN